MNELSTTTKQLPDTLPDLSRFVLIGREKLNAVRAEIRAIEKVGLAREVHEQKLKEAQEIAEAVLDAEVQIGKLTAELPKATPNNNPFHEIRNGAELVKPKSEALKEIGLNQDTAERFERLARHPEAVKKAKADAREEGRIVTRQNAIDTIHDMTWGKNKSPRQLHKEVIESAKQEREEFKEKQADDVVSVKDVVRDKENAETLAMDLWNRLAKMGNPISNVYIDLREKDIDITEMINTLPEIKIMSLQSRLLRWRSELMYILEVIND